MSVPLDPLEQIQDCVVGRLIADGQLAFVNVLEERKGVTDNDLAQTLGSMTTRGGKKGAALLIEIPDFDITEPNAPGPRLNISMVIRCVEKPLVNRGPGGAGISAEQMAMRVIQILHHFIVYSLPITLNAKRGEAAVYTGGERERAVLVGSMLQLTPIARTTDPVISGSAAGGVIITGPVGCSVYYSTDGSYPGPGNTDSTHLLTGLMQVTDAGAPLLADNGQQIYSNGDSIVVAPGTQICAVAYPPANSTNQASNVAAKIIS